VTKPSPNSLPPVPFPERACAAVVVRALEEDLGPGDLTAAFLPDPERLVTASLATRESCVLAGGPVVAEVFRQVDAHIATELLAAEGSSLAPGTVLARVTGPVAAILAAERTALNFVQRLSGIATLTHRFVEAVAGYEVRVTDTRKTTPGLRVLEKYAVRVGGAHNHRMGLYDAVMIKDNHRALGEPLGGLIHRARAAIPHTCRIVAETETLEQVRAAVEAGADIVLLDNMAPAQMRQAVALVAGRAVVEASGGVTLETIREIAATGVDCISVGALTHSARAVDMSLEMDGPDAAG
jgi:nicotinate-nucleotide pyrophosphorylase (carboxylating)